MPTSDDRSRLLRHLVATIAYRATVALRGFPRDAAASAPGGGARTPLELLSHVADLMHAAAAMALGQERPAPQPDAGWGDAEARLYAGLARLDAALADGLAPAANVDALLQGPLADALTHVGQLLLLRRLAGAPAEPRGYARAEIVVGVVGPEQRDLG